jgi:hypothetical protein
MKSEDQPHAKQISHAPPPETRRADPDREPVPVAGDAERKLPDARRAVAGPYSAFLAHPQLRRFRVLL